MDGQTKDGISGWTEMEKKQQVLDLLWLETQATINVVRAVGF